MHIRGTHIHHRPTHITGTYMYTSHAHTHHRHTHITCTHIRPLTTSHMQNQSHHCIIACYYYLPQVWQSTGLNTLWTIRIIEAAARHHHINTCISYHPGNRRAQVHKERLGGNQVGVPEAIGHVQVDVVQTIVAESEV